MDVFLKQPGQIINLIEQYDPAVIGGIMFGDLAQGVEPLLRVGRWQVLLDVVSVHLCVDICVSVRWLRCDLI